MENSFDSWQELYCVLKPVVTFFFNWQALCAGMLALLAAYITVRQMRKEAARRQDEVNEQRQRQLFACRALMPADLSTIVEYTKSCINVSCDALNDVKNHAATGRYTVPVLPERVFSNLQALIVQLDDQDRLAVSKLLACYQVQNARIRSRIDLLNTPIRAGIHKITIAQNFDGIFEKTLELYLTATAMFLFARSKAEHITPQKFDESKVNEAIELLGFGDAINSDLIERLKKQILAGDRSATV